MQGKVRAASHLLSENGKGARLPLDAHLPSDDQLHTTTVHENLQKKHPNSQPAFVSTLISDNPPVSTIYPVVFDSLVSICSTALYSKGSADPSGVDAINRRRLSTSFMEASADTCRSTASVARKLCTTCRPSRHSTTHCQPPGGS